MNRITQNIFQETKILNLRTVSATHFNFLVLQLTYVGSPDAQHCIMDTHHYKQSANVNWGCVEERTKPGSWQPTVCFVDLWISNKSHTPGLLNHNLIVADSFSYSSETSFPPGPQQRHACKRSVYANKRPNLCKLCDHSGLCIWKLHKAIKPMSVQILKI